MMAHLSSKHLTIIGMGALSSLLFSFIFSKYSFGPLLFLFAQIPLFYALFRYGAKPAFWSACIGFAFIFVTLAPAAIQYVLLVALPCVFLGKEALRPTPFERTLQDLVTIALFAGLLLMTVLFGFVELLLSSDEIKPLFNDISQVSLKVYNVVFSFDHLVMLLRATPGILVIGVLWLSYLSAASTHALLSQKGLSLRKTPFAIEALELDLWMWILLGGAILGRALGQNTFIGAYSFNVLLVLIVPFLLQGLSIMHVFCHTRPQGRGLLWTFYVFMVMCFWIVPFMVLLGIFEPWLQLRRRIDEQTRRRK
ncbi:MAG: DUF2232 domain-containing protein [Alphaproteobacteria bacterium]|nr:DUF2232 domain-containing protein [Alphaproteobacteria bacterium]